MKVLWWSLRIFSAHHWWHFSLLSPCLSHSRDTSEWILRLSSRIITRESSFLLIAISSANSLDIDFVWVARSCRRRSSSSLMGREQRMLWIMSPFCLTYSIARNSTVSNGVPSTRALSLRFFTKEYPTDANDGHFPCLPCDSIAWGCFFHVSNSSWKWVYAIHQKASDE